MSARIGLQEIATYLEANVSVPGEAITFGTAYDRDYITAYEETYPAIWVAGQQSQPIARDQSFSGLHRQKFRVTVPIRVVVQRYEAGVADIETSLDAIHTALVNAMVGWRHSEANAPFYMDKSQDGPATESLLVADVHFTTEINYTRTT